jgi:NAD(P)-dependent dehydrogenase (short-subunit alcohol dehydrogenase family)
MDVAGKVAIVTGAAGGIGAALGEALAAAGARVVLSDLSGLRLDEAAARVDASHPGRAIAVAADATSTEELSRLIATTETAFGPVDLFCANAGIFGGLGLGDTDEQWTAAIEVNLLAHVRAARLLLPGWLERGAGYFVSTASAAGLLTQVGHAPYAVTKHGAVAVSEWLSITYGDRGIRVSCLCPMGVNTDLLTTALTAGGGAQTVLDAGAVLEPDVVAAAVLTALADETFLILPHPEVLDFFRRKAGDYDRWLRGMRRLQAGSSH